MITAEIYPENPEIITNEIYPENPEIITNEIYPENPEIITAEIYPENPEIITNDHRWNLSEKSENPEKKLGIIKNIKSTIKFYKNL